MTPRKRKTDSEDSRAHEKRSLDYALHDDVCDRRLGWIKTAIWVIVGSVVLGGTFSYSQNEDMKQTNATQTSNITHNKEGIDRLDQKFEQHMREQYLVNKEILEKLNGIQTDVEVIKRGVQ